MPGVTGMELIDHAKKLAPEANIIVITAGKKRQLAKPINEVQLKYLVALGVKPDVFIVP